MGMDYGINNLNGQIKIQEVENILAFCNENGLKFLDTSDAYGNAEYRIGEISKKEDYSFEIISKLNRCNLYDISENIEKSFNRLEHKTLYAYLCHQFEFYLENSIVWKHFTELKESGKVKKIGFSLYSPDQLDMLIKSKTKFDIVQIPYNLFDQRFSNSLIKCAEAGVEVHVRSVFLQGLFFKSSKDLPTFFSSIKSKIEKLREYAIFLNLSIEHLLLLFVLTKSNIDKVVLGIDNLENLQKNLMVNEILNVEIDLDYLNTFIVKDLKILLPVNWKI